MRSTETWSDLDSALAKARQRSRLSREEIVFLLHLSDRDQTEAVFQAARELRTSNFGGKVFLYGFLYLSTYCRNDCSFCLYRKSNGTCPRYRKAEPEIVEAACELAASEVHLIDLTMGEDPTYFSGGASGFDKLVGLVDSIKGVTGLPVMVSAGVVPSDVLSELKTVGATWYACYQETHNRSLFDQLRPGQSYDLRLGIKTLAHSLGLLIEEGLLSGVGESIEDIADSLSAMQELDADQVRAMSFIPRSGTPMENWSSPDRRRELLSIAVMRLVFPDRLIPASLDVDGLAGLKSRLEAGANVVTSLVPPDFGLHGVARSSLDIDNSNRSAASVAAVLRGCGLEKGSPAEYRLWIEDRQKAIDWKT
jgi:methylornithine synthase